MRVVIHFASSCTVFHVLLYVGNNFVSPIFDHASGFLIILTIQVPTSLDNCRGAWRKALSDF